MVELVKFTAKRRKSRKVKVNFTVPKDYKPKTSAFFVLNLEEAELLREWAHQNPKVSTRLRHSIQEVVNVLRERRR